MSKIARKQRSPATNLWDQLDDRARLDTLQEFVTRRRRALLRFDRVVSVGIGYRTKSEPEEPSAEDTSGRTRAARRAVHDELCLRFLVTKKTKRAPANPVPKHVVCFVRRRGRRRYCRIPTDVDVVGKGEVQQDVAPDGVLIQVVPGSALSQPWPAPATGAICCRVVDANHPEDDYLLGCHHAFTLSSHMPNWAPAPQVGVHRQTGTQAFLGLTVRWTDLIPGHGRPGIDAALAKSTRDDELPDWVMHNPPKQVGRNVFPPRNVIIHTPRGLAIPAHFASFYGSHLFRYGPQEIPIGPVYEFVVSAPGVETQGGDSGSRIMSGDTVWGMHFYGVRDSLGYRSYAIPAFVLFADGRFDDLTIDLPPDQA